MFTDPGFDNPLGGTVETFTYTIDWGDGSEVDHGDATIDVPGGPGLLTRCTFDGYHTYINDGHYTVAITATDDDLGSSVTRFMTVIVENAPPVITSMTLDKSVINEGESVLVSGMFTDLGIHDTHTAVLDWGDGTTSDATINDINHTFTAQHQYRDNPATNPPKYTIGLTLKDNSNATDTESREVTVNNVAPTVDAGSDKTANEGQEIVFGGSFTDPGTLDTHTILWDFGDGTTGSGTLTPAHVYADNGTYTVRLTVTDDDGGTGTDTLVVAISNVAPTVDAGPDQTANEGEGVTLTSVTFNDKGTRDTHTASINWGDGTVEAGTVVETPFGPPGSTAGMNGTVSGSHVYADNGAYTVTITVNDDEGGTAADTLLVTVSNLPPTVNAGPDQTKDEGQTVAFDGAFTDPGVLDTHTILWDFGDGTTVAGSLTPSHVYADNGTYTVRLTVTDNDGDSGTDTLIVTVNNVAPTIGDVGPIQPVAEGATFTLAASFNDKGVLDTHTATINWGDGTTGIGTVIESPFGPPGDPAGMNGTVSGSHVYADNGTYTITLSVKDDDNETATRTYQVTVNNVSPTLWLIGNQEVNKGMALNLVDIGVFTDPGFANPLNTGGEVEETFTYSINWGDGTTSNTGHRYD